MSALECEDGYLVGVVRGLVQGRVGPSGEPLSGPGPDGLVVLRVCAGGPDAALVASVDDMVRGEGGASDVVTVGMVHALRRMVRGALGRVHGLGALPEQGAVEEAGEAPSLSPSPEPHVLAAVTAYRALYIGALTRIAHLLG